VRETQVQTEDEVSVLIDDQMPFHFRELLQGAALREYVRRTAGLTRYAPDVIRNIALPFRYQNRTSVEVPTIPPGVRCRSMCR
jgi:endonuclease/exonuclease/phosphatase family metal-dependent hydrolase